MRQIIWAVIKSIITLVFIIVFMAAVPFTRLPVSMLIMQINNIYQGAGDLTETQGIEIDMPSGRLSDDQVWYPFLMSYNAGDGFSKASGKNIDLTILYNFASYDALRGGSRFFEKGSPYNGAFYGAYLIKEESDPFTYMFNEEGAVIKGSALEIAKYDYLNLVIRGLGAPDQALVFDQDADLMTSRNFGGYEWTEISAKGKCTSPSHEFQSFQLGYLQFGLPYGKNPSDFEEISMHSRVWVTKIKEKNTTLVLYAMTPDPTYLEAMSQKIIYETNVVLN